MSNVFGVDFETEDDLYQFIADPERFAKERSLDLDEDGMQALRQLVASQPATDGGMVMAPGGAVAAARGLASTSAVRGAASSVADGALKALGATVVAIGAKASGILSIEAGHFGGAVGARIE